jgi:hypothetical protein
MKTIIAYGIIAYAAYYFYKKWNKKRKEASPEFKKEQEDNWRQSRILSAEKSYNGAQQAGLIQAGLKIDWLNSQLEVPNIGPYDGLVGWAAYVVATVPTESTISEIQRTMNLSYERACNLSDALMELGITKRNGSKAHVVMIWDLEKIKEMLDNLKQ